MHPLSTYFNQREINRINRPHNFVDPVTNDFPPKKSNYYSYLYDPVKQEYFDSCIKYFRDKNTKMDNHQYLAGLAGLCKSIITIPNIWPLYFSLCEDSHIIHLPEHVKDETNFMYEIALDEMVPGSKENDPINIQVRKISLFMIYYQSWPYFSKLIKKNYSDGLFHHFNFEEALFFLYYHSFPPCIILSKKKYHKTVDLYVNCLAAAIKSFMEKFHYTNDQALSTQNNESCLSEMIFLDFLDFYEKVLKTNEKTCKYYQ